MIEFHIIGSFWRCVFCNNSMHAVKDISRHCSVASVDVFNKWVDDSRFRFSKSKIVCMHFSQLDSVNTDPHLKLYRASMQVVGEFKFLGLIFDKKLSFNSGADCVTHAVLFPYPFKIRLRLCYLQFSSKIIR